MSMVQQLLKEHDAMRRSLVKLVGTDNKDELKGMSIMLPLLVAEIKDPELRREKQAIQDVIQVLIDVPARDERVNVSSLI